MSGCEDLCSGEVGWNQKGPQETCQGFEASVERLRDLGLFSLVK